MTVQRSLYGHGRMHFLKQGLDLIMEGSVVNGIIKYASACISGYHIWESGIADSGLEYFEHGVGGMWWSN